MKLKFDPITDSFTNGIIPTICEYISPYLKEHNTDELARNAQIAKSSIAVIRNGGQSGEYKIGLNALINVMSCMTDSPKLKIIVGEKEFNITEDGLGVIIKYAGEVLSELQQKKKMSYNQIASQLKIRRALVTTLIDGGYYCFRLSTILKILDFTLNQDVYLELYRPNSPMRVRTIENLHTSEDVRTTIHKQLREAIKLNMQVSDISVRDLAHKSGYKEESVNSFILDEPHTLNMNSVFELALSAGCEISVAVR